MKKLLIILGGIFCITSVLAQTTLSYDIDEAATANAPWRVGVKVVEDEDCKFTVGQCYREFLGITKSGHVLVKEFYLNGAKASNPFLMSSIDDAKSLLIAGRGGQGLEGMIIFWHENGHMAYKGSYHHGQPEGSVVRWYPHGQKEMHASYENGRYNGPVVYWYGNGKRASELDYKNGSAHGLALRWYENGQKEYEINFKDGKIDGLIVTWYANGQKESEKSFTDDKPNGLSMQWYENGQKSMQANYDDGDVVWECTWREDGELLESNGDVTCQK